MAKNPHAVVLGRKGGRARVAKGFSALTKKQRAEISAKGVAARKGKPNA